MKSTIHSIEIGVTDIQESIRFYREGLEFPMRERDNDTDKAIFDLKGAWLRVVPIEKVQTEPYFDETLTQSSGMVFNHVARDEDEVDRILAAAKSFGGEIKQAPEFIPKHGYSGIFLDPDGHHWEVTYPDFGEESDSQ